MMVIAFHTGGPYQDEADLLVASLNRLGIPHVVEDIGDQGGWHQAVSYKPIFISEMRRRFAGPLVSVDVDAFFHYNPATYFDALDTDFGAHWFQGPSGGYDRTRNDNWMLSGTTFWGDTTGARRLLHRWRQVNHAKQAGGDWKGGGQANLRTIVEGWMVRGDLKVTQLPGRYCYVFDKPWAYPETEIPIIEHTIASRENKDRSKGRVHAGRRNRIMELRWKVGLV